MIDPLMHVLRNAIDHGIEDGATPRRRGKPAVGSIDLSFVREGNNIVVRCQDDGAGLTWTRSAPAPKSAACSPPASRSPSGS